MLHSYAKGVSGNPKGRPKGSVTLATLLEQRLRAAGKDQAKAIIDAMIQDAINGPVEARNKAREMIFDRIDGKVSVVLEGTIEHNFHGLLLEAFLAAGLSAGVRAVESVRELPERSSLSD